MQREPVEMSAEKRQTGRFEQTKRKNAPTVRIGCGRVLNQAGNLVVFANGAAGAGHQPAPDIPHLEGSPHGR